MSESDRKAQKAAIIEGLMSLEAEELNTAIEHYEAFVAGSRLDGRETRDKDDLADSTESLGMAAAFDHPVQTHHAKIDVIENTDFGPKDEVAPGAVVVLDDRRFVVAVSTQRFEVAGETYMGISQQSPIFKAMAGRQAGDSFSFQGREIEIVDVF